MKRAFMSELAIVRTLVPSIAGVGLFIFVVLTLANASDGDSGMSAGACAVSAMCAHSGHELAGRLRQSKRMGALSGNAAPLAQRHHLRTLPLHCCLLGHHGVCDRAFEHHHSSVLRSHGMPSTGQIVLYHNSLAASMLISL